MCYYQHLHVLRWPCECADRRVLYRMRYAAAFIVPMMHKAGAEAVLLIAFTHCRPTDRHAKPT